MIGLPLWILLAASVVVGWQRHRWHAPAMIAAVGFFLMLVQHQFNAPWRDRAGLAPEPITKAVLMGVTSAIVFCAVYLLFFGLRALWQRFR